MNKKYLVILIFLIFLVFSKKKAKKAKKEWLFLLNGKNVFVNENKLELNLSHNIIGFTDRPYHDIVNLSKDDMKSLFNKINKPNTTLIAYSNDKKRYNSNCIIEINKIYFSEKKHKDIEIEFKILEGKLDINYFDNISLTIDDFWGWLAGAAKTISKGVVTASKFVGTGVVNAAKATAKVVKEVTNPKTYIKAFNTACKKVAYPIVEHVVTDAGIDEACTAFCPETAGAIDAAAGGPEDPVGDAMAVSELIGCAGACKTTLKRALKTYTIAKNTTPYLNKTDYLRDGLCNAIFKP